MNHREHGGGIAPSYVVVSDSVYLALGASEQSKRGEVFVRASAKRSTVGSFRMTPLGVLAPSLMEAFAVDGAIIDLVLRQLTPRCNACGELAEKPKTPDDLLLPNDGFLAGVIADDRTEVELKERCELLGVERVLVDGKVARLADGEHDEGEPVIILLSASHPDEFRSDLKSWLSRGCSSIRILHIRDRDSKAVELASVSAQWVCSRCNRSVDSVDKMQLLSLAPCGQCRGRGWIELADDRFISCEVCSGFGSQDAVQWYDWQGVALKYVAGASFEFSLRHAHENPRLREQLQTICAHGFGAYPIGAPAGLLSTGERLKVSLTNVSLSRISDISIVVDGASFWSEEETPALPTLRAVFPKTAALSSFHRADVEGEKIHIRDIERGPLTVEELSLLKGGVTLIQGEAGTGKSLLLQEIARMFSKRKKLSTQCSFPGLKGCSLVDSTAPVPEMLADCLGLSEYIAATMARTRAAREQNLLQQDFIVARSRFRCTACEDGSSGEVCDACGGSRFNRALGEIRFGSMIFAEILQAPLLSIAPLLWQSDVVEEIIRALPDDLLPKLRLSMGTNELTGPEQRALHICANLARIGAPKQRGKPAPLGSELILLNASMSIATAHQELVATAVHALNDRGATVVCARMPQVLERAFGSVLRLVPSGVSSPTRGQHRMYDVRLSRPVRLEIVSA